ncbi:hypothetical protein FJ527_28260 [Mesorhizobium sp. B2-4-18]|uniref:hypothetical protein n=1 Tax=Mesorhizobium sp. B2-4-18 TaxID=2589931 RepID=UPI00112941E6|nr:hypothetical protein [Mesorhizobium sp. B2-4-18]TPK70771.1 hypothetical protein FJ527_28260 [Mesorhizobium sp. B2-4-18]
MVLVLVTLGAIAQAGSASSNDSQQQGTAQSQNAPANENAAPQATPAPVGQTNASEGDKEVKQSGDKIEQFADTALASLLTGIDFVDAHEGFFLVVFTALLAVFTYMLRSSTDKLWKAGDDQMKLIEANAAQQSIDMQASTKAALDAVAVTKEIGRAQVQAYLSCASASFGVEDRLFRCWAVIKNNGQSPAFSVLVKAKLSVMVENEGWRDNPEIGISRRIDSQLSEGGGMTIPAGGEESVQILWLHSSMETEAYDKIAKTTANFTIHCRVEWRTVFHREDHNVFFLNEAVGDFIPVLKGGFNRAGAMSVYNRGHR